MASNLEKLYKDLNLVGKKEFILFSSFTYYSFNDFSLRYKNAIEEMKPEAMFCMENEPLMLFFNLENEINCQEKINIIHKQAWNFDRAPIIVISTSDEIVFYNAFDFDTNEHKLSVLTKSPKNFQNFAYENLYTGKLFSVYENKFIDKNRVNTLLFGHITNYREALIMAGMNSSFATILLSRIIFLKYLKDRKISINKNNSNMIKNSFKNKDTLFELFKYLKQEFNGDLFDVDETEKLLLSDDYMNILKGFFNDVDINGQLRLFIPFDFAIIPIELISSIYENFLNDKQFENKAYYTPTFLVDYMINTTINPFLNDKNKKDSNCKTLDPACGSGIFLVETLRKIIDKEEKIIQKKISANRLRALVENNIFGIDKDEDAINIAIFSLYITLLDYQNPRSILTFKFPRLKNKNFFVNNFFDAKANFNDTISGIDFILSNPPYGEIKDSFQINWFQSNKIPINDNQIAQSFLVRARDFCSEKTIISMIVLSKMLYNVKARKFRKYFLEKFRLQEVLELSSVRKQIFQEAITPVAILKYQYSINNTDSVENKFFHLSIKPNLFFKYFKILLIEKNDRKTVLQKLVYENDWLWKTLLFGNILDFYFVKRIIKNYKTINSYKNNLIKGKGIQIGGGDKQSTNHLIGLPFLDTKKKQLQPFKVILDSNNKFTKDYLHRNRFSIKEIFEAPTLLIKKGCNSNFECVSAVLNEDAVFTDSIGSIKFKDGDISKLYSLCGMLNSDFFTYFILNYISAVTIERNQMHFEECLEAPYIYSPELAEIVQHIHNLPNENSTIFTECNCNIANEKSNLLKTLNEKVSNIYELSEIEKDLIDYTINVTIPVWRYGDNIIKSKEPLAFKNVKKDQLKEYAQVFIETFEEQYKYFNIDVYPFRYCTLVNFKAREDKFKKPQINFNDNSTIGDIIKSIADCSVSDITNEIYIKKDIKGFNENSFFVIKTNEYKNWHRAIARLDVNEFSNAIWEAECELPE